MTKRAHVDFYNVVLKPDPSRTVVRPFAHYNEVHPHRALRYQSPREFIVQTCEALSGL